MVWLVMNGESVPPHPCVRQAVLSARIVSSYRTPGNPCLMRGSRSHCSPTPYAPCGRKNLLYLSAQFRVSCVYVPATGFSTTEVAYRTLGTFRRLTFRCCLQRSSLQAPKFPPAPRNRPNVYLRGNNEQYENRDENKAQAADRKERPLTLR